MRSILFALTISCLLFVAAPSPAQPRVMTWVPPYGVAKAKARLAESFDGVGPAEGITHLALQFWAPTKTGSVERVRKYGELSDATITEFHAIAKARGIRTMLCVYNGVEKWDWSLARAAFVDHREAFADALVAEAKRLQLDGIDIDLEGSGSFDADKKPFIEFMQALAERAHAAGLELTVDTFCYIWNAPNQAWWSELLPLVDGLTTMGYEETGANAKEWRAFSAQKKAAGEHASKLMIGLPAHKTEWQGDKALTHLNWLRDHGVGAALWDAQFEAPAWRTREVWEILREIRGKP